MYRTRSGARLSGAVLGVVWMLACSGSSGTATSVLTVSRAGTGSGTGAGVANSGCGALTRYIPYEDETSIIARGTFSKANGYGGIIVWTLQEGWLLPSSSGGRSQDSLMQALRTGFLVP
jgi:hypothetical protein